MQDTQNQTAKIGLDAGTYYVQITGTGVLTVGSAAYSFSVQYEDTYCETEQNNTIATADNYDRLGQTITGSIPIIIRSHPPQKDIFHFSYSTIK